MSAPLVVFGEDWGGLPSSTQYLIKTLMPARRVLWVDSIGLRRPRLVDAVRALQKLRAIARRRPAMRPGAGGDGPDMVYAPAVVPWPGSRLARAANRQLLGPALRRQMAVLGISRPILWASLPTAVDVVGTLGERAVVYYCGDDFGALDGVDHAPVLEAEARLAERADLILVSHSALKRKFDPTRTHFVPHGVDLSTIAAAPLIRSWPAGTKVAGFVGTIDGRLDQRVLAAAAVALSTWRFEFWGPVRVDVAPLARCPNVSFGGQVPAAEAMGRMRGFDVAMLPYRDTPMVRACNPLKLREYLAAGPPIAATPFPTVEEFCDVVEIGATPEEFVAALRRCSQERRSRATERLQRVLADSWEARGRQIDALLAGLGP